jgi:phosphatidylinositol 3-kinase
MNQKSQSLIWKYRYWLGGLTGREPIKDGLPKYLNCVNWNNHKEKKEASELLKTWGSIDNVQILELLSKSFKGNDIVRNFAVSALKKNSNEELLSILLQLVQALRYEKDMRICQLSDFLIERSLKSLNISHYLFWFLNIEIKDEKNGIMFEALLKRFISDLKKTDFYPKLIKQKEFFQFLEKICIETKSKSLSTKEKTEVLKSILNQSSQKFESLFSDEFQLPSNPNVNIKKILPQDTRIFTSNAAPVKFSFETEFGEVRSVLFKTGDDLRTDQLVIQMIRLMDKLLRDNALDLKLTPYDVISCSVDSGFIEFVSPNSPINSIITKNSDIQTYLWENVKNKKIAKHSNPEFLKATENFVKSCAGYCVISYILGIGDRHLDNLLIKPDGCLFHIDFGFILGNDPKPFPPPMKLCREMVEGMGGEKSENYQKFLKLCCSSYIVLRKHARRILNMFVLMIDANIENIVGTHGSDPMKNLMKLQEKFQLELNEEEAIKFMQSVIDESKNAILAQFFEAGHRWGQYFKN